jgi:hypothetical protein
MNPLHQTFLLLFIINLGTAFGAGVYEARFIISQWFPKSATSFYSPNPEAMHQFDTGRKFWVFITTIPLTLLTISGLLITRQLNSPMYVWWFIACLIILLERIMTFSFFIPTVIKLQKPDAMPVAKVTKLVSLWIRLNYVRCSVTLLGWIVALGALSVGCYK